LCQRLCSDDSVCLRDEENAVHVITNDVSTTGVYNNCVWNSVENYHLTHNYAVDIMHDLLEGACKYEMSLIVILSRSAFFRWRASMHGEWISIFS